MIGGSGWRRRVSAGLIKHLEATISTPAGAAAAAAGTAEGGGSVTVFV